MMKGRRQKRPKGLIIGMGMVVLAFILGILLVGLGITRAGERKEKIGDYTETVGRFVDYEVYHTTNKHGKNSTTYALIYEYVVDGMVYQVKTDYGSGSIPALGSEKTVLYDPQSPAEAVLGGMHGGTVLLFIGGFFVLVPLCMILIYLASAGKLGRLSWNIVDLVIGMVFLAMGLGITYIISGSVSLVGLFRGAGPFALIPILFLIVGVLEIIKCFRLREKDELL